MGPISPHTQRVDGWKGHYLWEPCVYAASGPLDGWDDRPQFLSPSWITFFLEDSLGIFPVQRCIRATINTKDNGLQYMKEGHRIPYGKYMRSSCD